MARVSKNARSGATGHKLLCACGGEVKMHSLFRKGKISHYAECEKCKRQERRPRDFIS